jgi:hypothetical protein
VDLDSHLYHAADRQVPGATVRQERAPGTSGRERKRPLLFPIRFDDAVLGTKEAWARLLRGQRHVGTFTRWKEHDAYRQALERLLRDLKVRASPAPDG